MAPFVASLPWQLPGLHAFGWVLVSLAAFWLFPAFASAQTLETREAELAEIRQEIEGLRSRLGEISDRESTLEDRLARAETELSLQEARLAEASAALEVATLRAAAAERRIQSTERDLAEVRDDLRRRLGGLYRLGREGYLRLFLALRPGNDLLPALRQLRFLVIRDQRALDRFASLRDRLLDEQERLEAQRVEMASWRAEERSRRDELAAVKARHEAVLAEVSRERRRLQGRADELQEKERKLTRFIDTLVEDGVEDGAAASPADLEGPDLADIAEIREFRGILDWPVLGAEVATEFGPRRDARYRTEVPHNGLGLAVEPGSRVRVVYPGKVLYASEFEGYGTMVVVHHPGRVFTLYAGLRLLNVAPDDVLSLGDVIGAAEDVLYFEIRVENQPVNPREWLR